MTDRISQPPNRTGMHGKSTWLDWDSLRLLGRNPIEEAEKILAPKIAKLVEELTNDGREYKVYHAKPKLNSSAYKPGESWLYGGKEKLMVKRVVILLAHAETACPGEYVDTSALPKAPGSRLEIEGRNYTLYSYYSFGFKEINGLKVMGWKLFNQNEYPDPATVVGSPKWWKRNTPELEFDTPVDAADTDIELEE